MKFRKKPVVIVAEQIPPRIELDRLRYYNHLDIQKRFGWFGAWGIPTLEGFMKVTQGDWIITGVRGERYPCKPDIFAETYEAVGDGETET